MLRFVEKGPVTVLTLDRPDRRNAVDHATLEALDESLRELSPKARVVVLTGAGGNFCSGADLSGVEDRAFVVLLNRVLVRLGEVPCVTVAAADGAALGAGTQLAVACDLRVATGTASFGIPAGRLGLAVDLWTVERLTLLAGHGPARAMLLAATVFSGEDLHRIGVVQRLGDLDDALAWADEIATLAPLTIRAHKAALGASSTSLPSPRTHDVQAAVDLAWGSEDLQEGLAAFRERRRPRFEGR